MTNGISMAVQLIGSLLKAKGFTHVYVQDPTYFIMINIFKDLGFEIIPFRLAQLQDELKQTAAQRVAQGKQGRGLLYLVPFHQNPTGDNISAEHIQHLVQFAQQTNTIVLSDETYQLLSFQDSTSFTSLCTYSDHIVTMGTFSKIFAPAFRLGWIVTKAKVVYDTLAQSGFMDSGGGVNPYVARLVLDSIDRPAYQLALQYKRQELQAACQALLEVLDQYPQHFKYVCKPSGGYFIFVESLKVDADTLWTIAKENGLAFHVGNKFSPGKVCANMFRLSFSFYTIQDIQQYFPARLAKVVARIDEITQPAIVGVLGGKGRLGSLIVEELVKHQIPHHLIDRSMDLSPLSSSSVIIDVSSPEGTIELLKKLQTVSIHPGLVIGTTGSAVPLAQLQAYATERASVAYTANFSVGVDMLSHMFKSVAPNYWSQISLTDLHHIHKKDAPSGTAKRLASVIEQHAHHTVDIQSIREGDNFGFHEIVLESEGEVIKISHQAKDRRLFAIGAIRYYQAIQTLNQKKQKEFITSLQ